MRRQLLVIKTGLIISFAILSSFNALNAQVSETWLMNSLTQTGGHNISVLGTPELVTTEVGQAVDFSGAGERFLVTANPIGTSKEFTVEVIFKPESGEPNITNQPRFIHIQDPADPTAKRIMLEIRVIPNGRFYFDAFMLTDKANTTVADTSLTYPCNAWIHAAITYRNDSLSIWVNGTRILTGMVGYNNDLLGANPKVSIGARQGDQYYFAGMIKAIRFTQAVIPPQNFMPIGGSNSIAGRSEKDIFIFQDLYDRCIYIKDIPDHSKPVYINLFDMTGRLISRSIVNKGDSEVKIDPANSKTGLYIIKLEVNGKVISKKIILDH